VLEKDGVLDARDVEVSFTGDLCVWSGRGHIASQSGDGDVELHGQEGLTVVPAVGA
jgi:hypothetical protein